MIFAGAVSAHANESLVWRGDLATARAFVSDLAKQYETPQHTKFTLQPFSTISGLDAVSGGSVDMAGSARPAMPNRLEEADLSFHPIAYDALVAITSPKNPVTNLSLKQLRDIYLGKLVSWKDVGGPDIAINVYAVAGPLDGIEYSTRLLLFKNGDQRVAAPRLYINTEKLEEGITLDPAGLGLSSLSGVYANKLIKVLTVEGVAASGASIADGRYPLSAPLYLVTRNNSARNDESQRFLAFLETPKAQELMRRHQLLPYAAIAQPDQMRAQQLAYIDSHLAESPIATAAEPSETPVSAPNATLAAKIAIAPTAPSTQVAKKRAEKANAAKLQKAGDGDH